MKLLKQQTPMAAKIAAAVGLLALSAAVSAAPVIYTETGDAGESIAGAQVVSGLGALDAIRGSLSSGADIFKIFLTGGQSFSATTASSSISYNAFDTALFLFDSAGRGVFANDDEGSPQSTLPAGGFSPAASGFYYLAIAGTGFLPISAGGEIFAPFFGTTDVVGPSGPGGASALSSWQSTSSESGDYEIVLTGAQFVSSGGGGGGGGSRVPEPASLSLAAVALAAAAWSGRRRARQS